MRYDEEELFFFKRMDQAPMPQGQMCKCPHHKMVPLAIALIGLVFLLRALGALSMHTADILWPILLIAIGLQKMMRGMCKCCAKH